MGKKQRNDKSRRIRPPQSGSHADRFAHKWHDVGAAALMRQTKKQILAGEMTPGLVVSRVREIARTEGAAADRCPDCGPARERKLKQYRAEALTVILEERPEWAELLGA